MTESTKGTLTADAGLGNPSGEDRWILKKTLPEQTFASCRSIERTWTMRETAQRCTLNCYAPCRFVRFIEASAPNAID